MTEPLCDTKTDSTAMDSVCPAETPPAFYEDMGFFQGDPLLHPEVKVGQTGFDGIPRPYQLWRDDWVTLIVLVCFVLLVMTQKILKRQLFSQAKEFFFPAKSIATKEKNNSGSGQLQPLLMMLILSIMGGLGVFMYTQSQLHLFTGQTPPYLFIALYIGIWILYFVFKNLFYYFVDWIFFDKSKRENWQKSYFFLLAIETLLFFPVIISTIYLNLPTHTPLWIVLTIGLLVKILLLYKTFQIFFPKIYGTLHLIVYFCTLEIMPLLVIFKVLIRVTEELIVKF